MNYSAGVIPFRENDEGKLEFLLGHPGGEFWKHKNYWAYLKGGVEKGENWLEAAKREFEEESGFSLSEHNDDEFIPLGTAVQNSKKTVIAYGLQVAYDEIDPEKCFSNLCEDNITPEIDKYRWFTVNELLPITHQAHLVFYKNLLEYFAIRILSEDD